MRYDKDWWIAFLENLNKSQFAEEFAHLGEVAFEVIDQPENFIVICWDKSGYATIIDKPLNLVATFSALTDAWNDFIDGKFNAGQGVLLGKIKFSGSLIGIMRYVNSFNHFSTIYQQLKL